MPTVELEEDDLDDDLMEQGPDTTDEPEEGSADDVDSEAADADEEEAPVAITLEGEEEEEPEEAAAPPKLVHAVKATRTRLKEINRENRELRTQLEQLKRAQNGAAVEIGPKPTLADAGWDESKFEADLDAWKERKRKVDEQLTAKQRQIEEQERTWKQTLADYASEKTQLSAKARLKDYDEAEEDWKEIFSDEQQGILLHASKKKAPMVYFLGKHPDKAHALAAIKDPIKLVYAIAELEAKLKVTASTARPAPDTPVRAGGTGGVSNGNRVLEKLEAEAERTGDRSKVIAFKRKMREKQR